MTTARSRSLHDTDTATSTRVLEALADREDIDPLDLEPPLYDVVDPDALDALFRDGRADGAVEFDYRGFTVRVGSDESVSIERR